MNYEQLALELKGMAQIIHAIAESPFENPEALVFYWRSFRSHR